MDDLNLSLVITIVESELDDGEVFEAIQQIKEDLLSLDKTVEADLILLSEAPPGSKSISGFLLNKLRAIVGIKFIKSALVAIGQHLYGSQIEIEAEGNGKKLKVKINRPDELKTIIPEVERFISEL